MHKMTTAGLRYISRRKPHRQNALQNFFARVQTLLFRIQLAIQHYPERFSRQAAMAP